jgi:hypothetical protein
MGNKMVRKYFVTPLRVQAKVLFSGSTALKVKKKSKNKHSNIKIYKQ